MASTYKYVLLLAAHAANIVLIIPFAYSCFADAFKAQFNMTQTNANILELSLTSTMMFLLPAGIVFKTYGITAMVVLHLQIATIGWGSVWLCVTLKRFLIRYPYVVWAGMLIAGHARSYVGIFVYVYVPQLVEAQQRSITIVALDIGCELGAFAISVIYENYFVRGHVADAENQSLGYFVVFLLVMEWLGGVLMVWVGVEGQKYQSAESNGEDLAECPIEEQTTVQSDEISTLFTSNRHSSSISTSTTNLINPEIQESRSFPRIYLLCLASVPVPISILYVQLQNITYITKSYSFIYLNSFIIIFTRVGTLLGKLILFFVVTKSRKYFYAYDCVLLSINVVLLISQVLLLLYGTSRVVFIIWFVLSTIILGIHEALLPVLMNDYFVHDYANKLSFSWSFISVFLAVIQVAFGQLYDREIPINGGQYCYGAHCFTNTFIMHISLSSIALISSLSLFYIRYSRRSSDQ